MTELKTWGSMNKLPDGVRIPNIKALNDAIEDGNYNFAISLFGGGLYSQKTINRKGKKYFITNHIDGSKESLTEKQLFDQKYTNIGLAIKEGALFTLGNGN